jgi:hypothetical protein
VPAPSCSGCVAAAMPQKAYLRLLAETGFEPLFLGQL